jgi:hypothetical protein
MGLPRSTYYDAPPAKADDAAIVATITAICDEFEAYGYRRIGAELRDRGMIVNSKKIRRLMREHGFQPKRRRRFVATTDSEGRAVRLLVEVNIFWLRIGHGPIIDPTEPLLRGSLVRFPKAGRDDLRVVASALAALRRSIFLLHCKMRSEWAPVDSGDSGDLNGLLGITGVSFRPPPTENTTNEPPGVGG